MKILKNKTTTISVSNDSAKKVTFADLAKICLNQVPEGGLNVTEMQGRLDVMKKLNTSNGEISLENAEAEILKICTKSMTWLMIHDDVVEFVNAVDDMKNKK